MEKKIESLIREHKIIAILRGVPSDKVVDVAKALYDGGIRLLEITFNQKSETKLIDTPNAIRAVREALGDKMVIGAGTVMSVEEVHAAKEAGASFTLAPNVDESVIRETVACGLESIPGAMTPSEIADAYRYGASVVKLFPAGNLGLSYCKAVMAPINHIPMIAVGGVDDKNLPVKAGEPGEVTITTLGVEGMPLLRFKTGDICYQYTEPCACGRNTIRLSSVLGRKGQMIKYKGTTLYPPALFDILDDIPRVKNYVVEVYTNKLGTDEILIRIGSDENSESFAKEIKDLFRSKIRVAPTIRFEPAEYISQIQMPPMSRKSIKFFDLR